MSTDDEELEYLRILFLKKRQQLDILDADQAAYLATVTPEKHALADEFLRLAKARYAGIVPPENNLKDWVLRCESPAEASLLQGLSTVTSWKVEGGRLFFLTPSDWCECVPQREDHGRRIDFAFIRDGLNLAVEVDGYAYHYATSDMADATLARYRELLCRGWIVVPFSASEVFRDAMSCAQQIFFMLRSSEEAQ